MAKARNTSLVSLGSCMVHRDQHARGPVAAAEADVDLRSICRAPVAIKTTQAPGRRLPPKTETRRCSYQEIVDYIFYDAENSTKTNIMNTIINLIIIITIINININKIKCDYNKNKHIIIFLFVFIILLIIQYNDKMI